MPRGHERRERAVRTRAWLALPIACAALVAGCGGGSDAAQPPAQQNPPAQDPVDLLTLSGTVTFDLVPAVVGVGLDYTNTRAAPARGVTVELVENGAVLASTVTDGAGAYSFNVEPERTVAVRVRAEMVQAGPPSFDYRVVDNVNGNALFVLDGTAASTGNASSTRDLHAPSGWDGTGYTSARSAAPFAILDAVYDSTQFVLGADPSAEFPPLTIHWSTSNAPSFGADGAPNPDTGELGTSFFLPSRGIFLLGKADADTEEYDRHVIVHEWGHYFEHAFSRSDNIGGPHTRGDQLDLRVAFGEGWGNALSAMVTGQSVYRDVSGLRQSKGFGFDVEGPLPLDPNPNPGWYSEESVQEILYDLFDDSPFDAAQDGLTLGFAPIFAVLTNKQRLAPALTSIFTFINALKAEQQAAVPQIDAIVNAHDILPIVDDYGGNQTNFGEPTNADIDPADLTAVYGTLAVGSPVNVCSLDAYSSHVTSATNKLGSRRFLRFTAAAAGSHTIEAVTTTMPAGETADPDMVLHRAGSVAIFDGAPDEALCVAGSPGGCVETGTASLTPGDYVLEVYEWTNTNAEDDQYPPIGRTCFDVTVTRP